MAGAKPVQEARKIEISNRTMATIKAAKYNYKEREVLEACA
jgi:hypothetical protein